MSRPKGLPETVAGRLVTGYRRVTSGSLDYVEIIVSDDPCPTCGQRAQELSFRGDTMAEAIRQAERALS